MIHFYFLAAKEDLLQEVLKNVVAIRAQVKLAMDGIQHLTIACTELDKKIDRLSLLGGTVMPDAGGSNEHEDYLDSKLPLQTLNDFLEVENYFKNNTGALKVLVSYESYI